MAQETAAVADATPGSPSAAGSDAAAGSAGLDRRAFLAGTGAAASGLGLGTLPLAAEPAPEERGEPFDDGTYFDDGYGWID